MTCSSVWMGRSPRSSIFRTAGARAALESRDGDDRPYERAVLSLAAGARADLYIHRYAAGPATRIELFVVTGSIREHAVPAGGIVGHPAVAGVLATGAIGSDDLGHDQLEAFSDYGASEIYFPTRETREKPELIGIDGVAITGAGGFSTPFYGTSAAAPHVAGSPRSCSRRRVAPSRRSRGRRPPMRCSPRSARPPSTSVRRGSMNGSASEGRMHSRLSLRPVSSRPRR